VIRLPLLLYIYGVKKVQLFCTKSV